MAVQEWKKFDVVRMATVSAAVSAVMGLILGIAVAVLGTALLPGMVGFGILSIVAFPIMYGIAGLVFGALGALIYNFVAEKIGGIRVTV
ncbi:MAG: hypothetical protein QW548_01695 [Candidatus Aenigmatarchaeota archaeon]